MRIGRGSNFRRFNGGLALAALAFAAALAIPIASAKADPQSGKPAEQAESLFREGRDALRRHDYVEACSKFQQSDGLDPSPGTRLNWAICDEQLGHLARALAHARWALDRLAFEDNRRPIAERLVTELNERVARLSVRLGPGAGFDTRVYVDGEPLPLAGAAGTRDVDPGEHIVRVEETAHEAARVIVTLREGEAAIREVSVGPPTPGQNESARAPMPTGRPAARTRRNAGYVLAAGAAAELGAAAILAVLAVNEHEVVLNHCPGQVCDSQGFDAANRGRGFVNSATVLLGIGVSSAVSSAVLLWTQKQVTAASIVPFPGGAELEVVRRF